MAKLHTIAFVTPLRVNYDRKVAEGVAHYVSCTAQLRLRLCHMVGFEPMPDQFAGIDGVLGVFSSSKELANWKRHRIPVINIGANIADEPRVHVNDLQIGEMAATYFFEHGHSHFLYVNGFPYSLEGENPLATAIFDRERQTGFQQALQRAGHNMEILTLDGRRLFSSSSWQLMLEELVAELQTRPKPLAVFAMADSIGRFILQACQVARIAVPSDVAVIGVDNDELFCNSVAPPLSSIAQGEERLGWEAAQLLDQMLLGRKTEKVVRLNPLGVVERASSAITCGDPVIAAGLVHIRQNLNTKIDLRELAKRLNLSQRNFERRMLKAMGMTAGEFIGRMRMERARHLLVNSRRPLKDIYIDCGFVSPEHFHRTFKRSFDTTPAAYRRQNRRHG